MLRMRLTHFFALVILLAFLAAQSGQSVPVKAASQMAAAKRPAGKDFGAAAGFYNQPTDQMIVKYKDGLETMQAAPDSASQAERLSQAAGVPLTYFHAMSGGAHVMKLAGKRAVAEVAALAQRLMALPEVEYAEPDRIAFRTRTPNDPYYANQWHYTAPVYSSYGINLPAAWDITTGSASVVMAVLDTGITNHPEFSGRTVPGYDFIMDVATANDGDGRDANPSDPGDWIEIGECGADQFYPSSWHGTHNTGTIGAASNNGAWVAGVNWDSKILPVRVLGKCGGYESDVVDSMRWAAGLPVTGVPANQNPARVLSLSLSGSGACSSALQNAVSAVTAAGTTVVVSAGSSDEDASKEWPANCSGVITVAATDRYGDITWYSNYGSAVEIAAPGGNVSTNTTDGILSTLDTGTRGPASPTYGYMDGTSMSTPQVAGVVALMYSVRPALTPAQVLYVLQNTATHFPSSSRCHSYGCGSGVVNAGAAVAAVLPIKTSTTITAHTPNPSAVNQAVTVKYTVTPASGSGTPTGMVTVSAGTDSCSGTVAAGQCALIFTSFGSKTIAATYAGDANYSGSTSAGVVHTIPPAARLWIPVTLKEYVYHFAGPMESEPNNTYLQANGPLNLGQEYLGYPNDEKDYFSFDIGTTSNIRVILNNHSGSGVQLQLFYQNTSNRVAWDYSPPYALSVSNAKPGRYYVYIYTQGGFNTTTMYHLTVNP